MKKIIVILILSLISFILSPISYALDMESSQYQLKYTNINITSGNKESEGYKLSDTVGQTAAGEFHSTGYIVKAGFQYLREYNPFRFTVSDTSVDLGILTPNVPSTKTITLTVTYGSARQYQVTAIEEGPLSTLDSVNVITDTVCNGGNNTCSESQAKIWNSNTTYGFGYNLAGHDIPSDFRNANYFRPFPDLYTDELDTVVMINDRKIGKNRQADLTFKANISNLQPAGSYQTVISFLATPSY